MRKNDVNNKKSGKVSISHRVFFLISVIYLIAPILVFFFAWLRLYIALPASLLLGFAICYAFKDANKDNSNVLSKDSHFDVSIVYLIVISILSVLLAYALGIGEYIWSVDDHAFRRAIFRDLVSHKWPVFLDLTKMENPEINAMFPDTQAAFSYYFSFWMIPALVGKVFGFGAGNVALLLWSALGLFLIILGISMICKRETYLSVFALVFFSGLDIIPYIYFEFFAGKESWMWLEGYTQHIVYISNINNLLNVFNQVIPCYLIVVLLGLQKNTRSEGLIAGTCFAYSPWATFGMLPIAVYYLFAKKMRLSNDKVSIKNILSIGNIIPAAVLFLCFAPMYMANSGATSISGNTISFYGGFGKFLLGYLFVFVIEILPSFLLFGKRHFKDGLFWTVIIALMLMPFYKITYQNDFTMRGAMPLFFVLTIMFADFLSGFAAKYKGENAKNLHLSLRLLGKSFLILVMACVALQMFLVIFTSTLEGQKGADDVCSLENIGTKQRAYICSQNFYVYDYEDTFFYSHMAKPNPN